VSSVVASSEPPVPTLARDPRLKYYPIDVRDGAPIFLRRACDPPRGARPLLLTHGASAAGDTFLAPRDHSFFEYLVDQRRFDIWILDWRGSFHVASSAPPDSSADKAASQDFPEAIRLIHAVRDAEGAPPLPLAIVAHCMGAGVLAMSIGGRLIAPTRSIAGQDYPQIDRIVFSSIGLFYQVTWDGWTKVQDRLLERVADQVPPPQTISPTNKPPWPKPLEEPFQRWPRIWGPPAPFDGEFFQRLSFMFGQCFLVSNLHELMTPAAIEQQFGPVPLTFYRHAAQNALRGFAAKLDAEGMLDPATPNERIPLELGRTYMNLERFRPFDITLLTGSANPLWHRDSVDLMGEWLARLQRPVKKIIVNGYGHQDLWWGKHSRDDVFPRVLKAISAPSLPGVA
jgi:hypothetical protein